MEATTWAAWVGASSGLGALGWQVFDRLASRRPGLRLHGLAISDRFLAAVGSTIITAETFEVQVVNKRPITVTVDRVSVERPTEARARFVSMRPAGAGQVVLQDGEAARYGVELSSLVDDDHTSPVTVHVLLASGHEFVSSPFKLSWSMAEGQPRPKLRRVRSR